MSRAVREAAGRYLAALTNENVLAGHTFETCADLDLHQIALDLAELLPALTERVEDCTRHLAHWGGMPPGRPGVVIRRQTEALHAEIGTAVDSLNAIARAMPSGEDRVRAEAVAS